MSSSLAPHNSLFFALCSERLHRGFQAGSVGHIEHFRPFINPLHEAAEGSAGTQLDKTPETLAEEVTHARLPSHGGSHLLDQAGTDLCGVLVRLGGHVGHDLDRRWI